MNNKRKSIRKVLGKEQYELIKERNGLIQFIDCSIVYGGCDETEVFKFREKLKVLDSKIETLKLFRITLKKKMNKAEVKIDEFGQVYIETRLDITPESFQDLASVCLKRETLLDIEMLGDEIKKVFLKAIKDEKEGS